MRKQADVPDNAIKLGVLNTPSLEKLERGSTTYHQTPSLLGKALNQEIKSFISNR